jgi:hypothetical protein
VPSALSPEAVSHLKARAAPGPFKRCLLTVALAFWRNVQGPVFVDVVLTAAH